MIYKHKKSALFAAAVCALFLAVGAYALINNQAPPQEQEKPPAQQRAAGEDKALLTATPNPFPQAAPPAQEAP